jgi:hypothetical protein
MLFALLLLTVHAEPGVWVASARAPNAVPWRPGWLAAGAAACLVPVLLQDALQRRRARQPDGGSGEPVAAAFAISALHHRGVGHRRRRRREPPCRGLPRRGGVRGRTCADRFFSRYARTDI